MQKFSLTIPVRIGVMAYVAVVMLGLMSYFFYKAMFMSMFLSGVVKVFYLAMVLMLAIWSGIAYRSTHHNVISFPHAFLSIYIVFVFCSFGNVFSTLIVNKLIDKGFPAKVYAITIDKTKAEMKRMNKTEEQQKEELALIKPEDFNPSYLDMVRTLATLLGATAIFSLLVAMFIKRSSEDLIRMHGKNTISG